MTQINLSRVQQNRDRERSLRDAERPHLIQQHQKRIDAILRDPERHDPGQLLAAAAELRKLPGQMDMLRYEKAEAKGFELLAHAIRYGAFAGPEWLSFRTTMSVSPNFGSAGVLLVNTPKFNRTCEAVADEIERQAKQTPIADGRAFEPASVTQVCEMFGNISTDKLRSLAEAAKVRRAERGEKSFKFTGDEIRKMAEIGAKDPFKKLRKACTALLDNQVKTR